MNSSDTTPESASASGARSLLAWLVPGALFVGFVLVLSMFMLPPSQETGQPGEAPVAVSDTADLDIKAAELNEEKQRYIWDIEHITFELETRFGKPFVKAIIAGDDQQLRQVLRSDFRGSLFSAETSTLREHAAIRERQRRAGAASAELLEGELFVARLRDDVRAIKDFDRGRLRVLKLDRDAADEDLWHAHLLLSLVGRTAGDESIILESEHDVDFRFHEEREIRGAAIVQRWVAEKESVRTSALALMDEVTVDSGLADLPLIDNWNLDSKMVQQYWMQLAVEDFDRDGFLDIAAATFLGQPFLLRSEGGRRFRNVAQQMGIRSWAVDDRRLLNLAAWIDYDNDGFPDLLLGDRLYHNRKGRRFVDVTQESGLVVNHHPMGGVVADFDCDGLLDLYLLYQMPHEPVTTGPQPWVGDTKSGTENHLWRNLGGGRFRNVTQQSGAGGGPRKSFAATWHFLDDDRFPDLYVANDFGNNVHLRNRGDGTFEDVSLRTGMQDFATSMGVTSGDIDNDGSPEIYVANMYSKMGRRIIQHVSAEDYPDGIFAQIQGSCAGNRLYRRQQGERFEDISDQFGVNPVGWAYAPAMVDLDGDGWLDIYAATGFMSFTRGKPDG